MRNTGIISAAIAVALLFSGSTAHAVGIGFGQARATGMAGAYTALATGTHAPNWNPANLATRQGPSFELGILNMGVLVGNDGLKWGDFVDWTSDEVLTTEEIQSALNQFPGSSVSIHQSFEFGMPVSMAIGRYALTWNALMMTEIGLSRGVVDMISDDPSPDHDYGTPEGQQAIIDHFNESQAGNVVRDLSGMKSDAWMLSTVGISHARRINVPQFDLFAVGGTLNFYAASPRFRIVESSGQAVSRGFTWDTDARLVMELGGASIERTTDAFGDKSTDFEADGFPAWGLGFNVGVAGTWEEDLDFSAALHNIPLRKITWNTAERRTFHIRNDEVFNAKTFTDAPDGMSTIDYLDSLLAPAGESVHTREKLGSISAAAPSYLRAGIAKQFYAQRITWTLDVEQGFNTTAVTSTTPRVSSGIEYRPFGRIWPLRAGMSVGGRPGHFATLGTGLHLGFLRFDVGLVKQGAYTPFEVPFPFAGASKGVGFAMDLRLSF